MQKAETELASVCEELSELRKVYGKQLEGRIIQGLQDLNFLDVKLRLILKQQSITRQTE